MAAGGSFSAILRDPICRLHSLFTHHHQHDVLKTPHLPATPMDYTGLVTGGEVDDTQGVAINDIRSKPLSLTENWFATLGKDIVESDLDIATNCDPEQVLRHEDMVGSIDSLTESFSRILDTEVGNDFPGFAEHFGRPVNVHSAIALSAGEIFSRWPDKFKKIFFFNVLYVGFDALEKGYANYGYALPDEAKFWLELEVAGATEV